MNADRDTQRCSKLIWGAGPWPSQSGCQNRGSVTEDGQPWCKTHAPSRVKARRDEMRARWRGRSVALAVELARDQERVAAVSRCVEALRQIARGRGEPVEVARAALARLDASEGKEVSP
mgnify:CR=1 FL=1